MTRTFATMVLLTGAFVGTASAMEDQHNDEDLYPNGEGPGSPGGPGQGGGPSTTPPEDHAWRSGGAGKVWWGSDDWAAGYGTSMWVGGRPAQWNVSHEDELFANASLDGLVKLAGIPFRLVGARIEGVTTANRGSKASAGLYIGAFAIAGSEIRSDYAAEQSARLDVGQRAVFLDKRIHFWLGPVPVQFRAIAEGDIGIVYTGRVDTLGLHLAAKPLVGAGLYASAAIGGEYCVMNACAGASAGIEGELVLFELSLPLTLEASLVSAGQGHRLDATLKATLDQQTMSGHIAAYAAVTFLGKGMHWAADLFRWDPAHTELVLVEGRVLSQCISAAPCAVATGAPLPTPGVSSAPTSPAPTPPPPPKTSTPKGK